jgi:hypothetical protein
VWPAGRMLQRCSGRCFDDDGGRWLACQGCDATEDVPTAGDDVPGVSVDVPASEPCADCAYGALKGIVCAPAEQIFVAAAKLTIEPFDCDGNPTQYTTTSKSDGTYDFEALPCGEHTVSVQSGSFTNRTHCWTRWALSTRPSSLSGSSSTTCRPRISRRCRPCWPPRCWASTRSSSSTVAAQHYSTSRCFPRSAPTSKRLCCREDPSTRLGGAVHVKGPVALDADNGPFAEPTLHVGPLVMSRKPAPGAGTLVDTTFHNDEQADALMLQILYYRVFLL